MKQLALLALLLIVNIILLGVLLSVGGIQYLGWGLL